jgi:hypothetical protein
MFQCAIFSITREWGILKNSVQRVALRAGDGLEFFCELFVQHPGRIISNRDPEIAQFFKNDSPLWIALSFERALALGGFLPRVDGSHDTAVAHGSFGAANIPVIIKMSPEANKMSSAAARDAPLAVRKRS